MAGAGEPNTEGVLGAAPNVEVGVEVAPKTEVPKPGALVAPNAEVLAGDPNAEVVGELPNEELGVDAAPKMEVVAAGAGDPKAVPGWIAEGVPKTEVAAAGLPKMEVG